MKLNKLLPLTGIATIAITAPIVTSCGPSSHLTFNDSEKVKDIGPGAEITVLCTFTLTNGFEPDEDIVAAMKNASKDTWSMSCMVQGTTPPVENQMQLRFTYTAGAVAGDVLEFDVEITCQKATSQTVVWTELAKGFKFTYKA